MTVNRKYDEKVLSRFVKDTGIPIVQTWDVSLFESFVELYDPIHKSVSRYKKFCRAIDANGVDAFFQARSKFIDEMKATIKRSEAAKALKSREASNETPPVNTPNDTMYKDTEPKAYMSIDVKAGNFTALQRVASTNGLKPLPYIDYEQMARDHTDCDFLVESKQIRQLIFGQTIGTAPVPQQLMMTENVASLIKDRAVRRMGPDEIYFEIEPELVGCAAVKAAGVFLNPVLFHVRSFMLERLSPRFKHYVKKDKNGKVVDICCVQRTMYPQAFKRAFGLPVTEDDKIFMSDGLLVKFVDNIYEEN